jgi:hypothetical protein
MSPSDVIIRIVNPLPAALLVGKQCSHRSAGTSTCQRLSSLRQRNPAKLPDCNLGCDTVFGYFRSERRPLVGNDHDGQLGKIHCGKRLCHSGERANRAANEVARGKPDTGNGRGSDHKRKAGIDGFLSRRRGGIQADDAKWGVAPSITSTNSTTFTVGTAGTFTVTTTGTPTPSLTETGALPSGLTFKGQRQWHRDAEWNSGKRNGGYLLTLDQQCTQRDRRWRLHSTVLKQSECP